MFFTRKHRLPEPDCGIECKIDGNVDVYLCNLCKDKHTRARLQPSLLAGDTVHDAICRKPARNDKKKKLGKKRVEENTPKSLAHCQCYCVHKTEIYFTSR